jgi:CubicO group peptidase (beta-lactamase class C family)
MAALAAFLAAAVACRTAAIAPARVAEAKIPAAKIERIERLVAEYMSAHKVPALAMAVVVNGELAWSRGFGLADLENHVPATETTMFRTASIGKPMTATAAMQLVERRQLDLDADVRDYCPAFPSKEWTVTPRELLSHTSGIRHYGGPRDREEQSSTTHYKTVAEALAPFKDDPLLFEPGTKYSYSTYGYDVLGCVIEGAAGMPFLAYMRRFIWEPAGMTATRDDDPSALIPQRASGYAIAGGELRKAQMVDMSNRMPAGGYTTTVVDLARFAQAVMANRLVTSATLQRMITPTSLRSGERVGYGLGWGLELEPWHDDAWVVHGGSSPGFSGFVALMPRHRFAAAFLTNLEDLPGRGELAEGVTRIVLGFDAPAKSN